MFLVDHIHCWILEYNGWSEYIVVFEVKTSKQLAKILAFSLTVSAGLYLEILLCVTINHSRWNCRCSRATAASTITYTSTNQPVYIVKCTFFYDYSVCCYIFNNNVVGSWRVIICPWGIVEVVPIEIVLTECQTFSMFIIILQSRSHVRINLLLVCWISC